MRTIDIDENSIHWSELSNYSQTPFKYNKYHYKTALHAYYSYLNRYNIKNILSSKTIEELQEQVGFETYKKAASLLYHKKWFDFSKTVETVRAILCIKLLENPTVKHVLLQTGDAYLRIINGSDLVLGTGKSRLGYNLTGILLMEIREHLRYRPTQTTFNYYYYPNTQMENNSDELRSNAELDNGENNNGEHHNGEHHNGEHHNNTELNNTISTLCSEPGSVN